MVTITAINEDGYINYIMPDYIRFNTGNIQVNDMGDNGYIEFDTSSIPDNATITSVLLRITSNTINTGGTFNFKKITGKPSTATDGDLYVDIDDGTIYATQDIQTITTYEITLTGAASDLQSLLSSDWFAVGINETGINIDVWFDDETQTNPAELDVNYTIPATTAAKKGGGGKAGTASMPSISKMGKDWITENKEKKIEIKPQKSEALSIKILRKQT